MDLHTFERIEYGRCPAALPAGGEIDALLAQAGARPCGTFSPLVEREPVLPVGDIVRAVAAAVARLLASFAADRRASAGAG